MSKSETKGLHLLERRLENLGIMRLRIGWMKAIRAFVTDLDTQPLFWLLLCLWTWVTVLCQDIGDTSVGSGGDTCGLRLSGEL